MNKNQTFSVTRIKALKKGFIAVTKEGHVMYFKVNVNDIIDNNYKIFTIKTLIVFKNYNIVNKVCNNIDFSLRDTHVLISLEDGTSFIQNITGIEIDTVKLNVKP